MRLDKFLAETGVGSRKEVKQLLKKKLVTVNGTIINDGKTQIHATKDTIDYAGTTLMYQPFYYYMLHKPQGVVSATEDAKERTVMELLNKDDNRRDLFPVGRLDKDTEGLLLITNDGQLAHALLSPKKHVDKEYYAVIRGIVSETHIMHFQKGFTLKNGEKVKPSQLTIEAVDKATNSSRIRLVIQEGKFHQVKRMFEAIDRKVTYLKRLRMGTLQLDETLALGAYRPLTEQERKRLIEMNEPNPQSSEK